MPKTLKEQIRDREIGPLYLFFGPEKYLVSLNTERVKRALLTPEDEMMNLDDVTAPRDLILLKDSIETLPFLSEKRLVIIRESGAFTAKKEEGPLSGLTDYVGNIPESSTVIFVENDVDKRSKLYKAVSKYGQVFEFERLSEQEMGTWIRGMLKKAGKTIGRMEMAYLMGLLGDDMAHVESEIRKLIAYMGTRSEIGKTDIDDIISPTVEEVIFNMTDAMGEGKSAKAYKIYRDLLRQGEAVQMIFYMIIRQIRQLYNVAAMEGMDQYKIASELKLKPFIAEKLRNMARRMGKERLKRMLFQLLEYDVKIKTGEMSAEEAVDLVLLG